MALLVLFQVRLGDFIVVGSSIMGVVTLSNSAKNCLRCRCGSFLLAESESKTNDLGLKLGRLEVPQHCQEGRVGKIVELEIGFGEGGESLLIFGSRSV